MPTRFCLVRHGETTWNAERRLQGQTDIPLNQVGRAQAKAAASRLATERFDALYSSDLSRALETAAPAAALLGLKTQPTETLRERFFGAFQSLTHEEAQARYPEDYARFRARDPDHCMPDDGESLRAFSARIEASLGDLAGKHRGQTLLVVTHGGVLDMARRLATGRSLQEKRDFPLRNAALNWIEHCHGRWGLLSWGETAHLERARDEVFDAGSNSAEARIDPHDSRASNGGQPLTKA